MGARLEGDVRGAAPRSGCGSRQRERFGVRPSAGRRRALACYDTVTIQDDASDRRIRRSSADSGLRQCESPAHQLSIELRTRASRHGGLGNRPALFVFGLQLGGGALLALLN